MKNKAKQILEQIHESGKRWNEKRAEAEKKGLEKFWKDKAYWDAKKRQSVLVFLLLCAGLVQGQTFPKDVSIGCDSCLVRGTFTGRQIEPKIDTVSTMMVVTDTAITVENRVKVYDNKVFYLKGYSVRESTGVMNGYTGDFGMYMPVPIWKTIKYLDENKNPLKASIIVWMNKNINQ